MIILRELKKEDLNSLKVLLDELNNALKLKQEIKSKTYGDIIRMKGFLSLNENTSMRVDYVLSQIYITEKSSKSENVLVIIGKDLNTDELKEAFK